MRFDAYLNEEQLRAVETKSQYAKVVAGAGSGKTRVLTFRIAHLIVNENVIPRSILGVTFTNKAAKEIKDRVYKLLPELQEGNNDVQLSTIHSWCARFLRYNAPLWIKQSKCSISVSTRQEVCACKKFTTSL